MQCTLLWSTSIESLLKVEAHLMTMKDLENLLVILPQTEISSFGLNVSLVHLGHKSQISMITRQDKEKLQKTLKEKLPLTRIQKIQIMVGAYNPIFDEDQIIELNKFFTENNIEVLEVQ